MANDTKRKGNFSHSALRTIVGGFMILILFGGLLLALPIATNNGKSIGYLDGVFTATSAVCVTGLIVRTTSETFSLFGQIVILALIQIGGLGFITFAVLGIRLVGKRISLRERMLIREAMNEDSLGGMVSLIRWVGLSALIVELSGAAMLAIRFIPMYGAGKGIYFSIFHSISAFCNAGFDLVSKGDSLTAFRSDVLINISIMLIIIIGGLGFGVLRDICHYHKVKYLRLQTRIVLVTYFTLFFVGFFMVLIGEWSNPKTLGNLSFGDKLLAAAFQSVTLRTAGFNTISQHDLRPVTKFISGILMFIGASPASTGGGIKVTTIAVIVCSVIATAKGKDTISIWEREIDGATVRRALSVCSIALTIVFVDMIVISLLQPELDFMDIVLECTSAMGTVGISGFGSQKLCTVGRILIILTMYFGRVGPLSIAIILSRRNAKNDARIRYPQGHIMIG